MGVVTGSKAAGVGEAAMEAAESVVAAVAAVAWEKNVHVQHRR